MPKRDQQSSYDGQQDKQISRSSRIAIGSIVLGALSLVVSGLLIARTTRQIAAPTITVDNLSQESLDSLTGNLAYSGSGTQQYYSPSLEVVLSYDKDTLNLSEDLDADKGVRMTPTKGGWSNVRENEGAQLTVAATGTDFDGLVRQLVSELKKQSPTASASTSTVQDGVQSATISHTIPLLGKKETVPATLHVLARTVDTSLYYITFIEPIRSSSPINAATLTQVLNTLSTDTANLEKMATVQLDSCGLEASFDRSKWSSEVGPLRFSLKYLPPKSTPTAVRNSMTADCFQIETVSEDNSTALEKEIEHTLEQSMLSATEQNGKNIDVAKETVFIAGQSFWKLQYDQEIVVTPESAAANNYRSTKNNYRVTEYVGADPTSKHVVSIRVAMAHPVSAALQTDMDAVIQSLRFIPVRTSLVNPFVRGEWALQSQVLGKAAATIDKATLMGKAAVVRILNTTCNEVVVKNVADLPTVANKTYRVCSGGLGSGFYISENGMIATNAHVAHPNPTDVVIEGMVDDKGDYVPFWQDFGQDVVTAFNNQGVVFQSQDHMTSAVLITFLELEKEGIIVLNPTYANYVQGSVAFELGYDSAKYDVILKNAEEHQPAVMVDGKEIESSIGMQLATLKGEKVGITQPDLAIISVSDSATFPSIFVGDSDLVSVGTRVQAVGFPGAADNRTLFSDSSGVIPTITSGMVSAIKPNFDNSFNLIQMDASIGHGNSGGPIITDDGEVIGIATYGVGTDEIGGNFNAGVPSAELTKMIAKADINNTISMPISSLSKGLDYYSKQYYRYAVAEFQAAKDSYAPIDTIVDPLIESSQKKIDEGEDESPLFMIGSFEVKLLPLIGSIVGIILMTIGVIVAVIAVKKRKQPPQTGSGVQAGVQPTAYAEPAVVVSEPQVVVSAPPLQPEPVFVPEPAPAPIYEQPIVAQAAYEPPSIPQQAIPTEQLAPQEEQPLPPVQLQPQPQTGEVLQVNPVPDQTV